MFRDRLHEALRRAAAPTLERMREDRERLPHQLSALMAYLEEHLCDPELNVTRAMRATKVRSHSLQALFRAHTETTLRAYIEVARLEIADRLLRQGEFEVGRISIAVGFGSHATFLRAFKAWADELPSEVGSKSNPPEIDYANWRRAWRRELASDVARDYLVRYVELYPEAGKLVPDLGEEADSPLPRIVVDGEHYVRSRAEEVWREIRDLAPEAQRRRVRCYEFHSTALFDLLRKNSRQEGRRDRRRGIDLARLALVSLESSDAFFGDRIHDLRALGHAWLGNAYRLARDFSAADAAFERAEAEWHVRRPAKDYRVLARIRDLETSLRIFQRSYGEARRLVDRCQELFQSVGDLRGMARSLIQRATIDSYTGQPEVAIVTLEAAKDLADGEKDPHLGYVLYASLANVLAKVGRYPAASKALSRCRDYCNRLDHPLGAAKVQWVGAAIQSGMGKHSQAEYLLTVARGAYEAADEVSSFGIVSLDLAILYSEQGRLAKGLKLVAEAVPILQSQELLDETLSAVTLLARAVEAGEVSAALLRQVRDTALRDPLADCSP